MRSLKLYVWRDGDEVFDYEAIAVAYAKTEEEALELLENTDDKLYNQIKDMKPIEYEDPNAFFIRGYPYVKMDYTPEDYDAYYHYRDYI